MLGGTMYRLSPDEAAKELDAKFRKFKWYIGVGIGASNEGDVLFVYVKSDRHQELREIEKGWRNYNVAIRAVGDVRPVLASAGNSIGVY